MSKSLKKQLQSKADKNKVKKEKGIKNLFEWGKLRSSI